MEFFKNKKEKKIRLVLFLPIALIIQYYRFSNGIISPLVKGVEIQIIGGNYIKGLDKYIVKLDDTVEISAGDYIVFPGYAKDPEIWFNVLDDSGLVEINGDKMTALKEGYTSIAVMKKNRVIKKATIKVVNPEIESLNIELSKKLEYVGDSAEIKSKINVLGYEKFQDSYKAEYKSDNEKVIKIEGNNVKAVGVGNARISAKCGDETVETDVKIEARVSDIDIPSVINIEKDQKKKIDYKIITSPRGLEHPKVKFSHVKEDGNEDVLKILNNGNIKGLKEGSTKIRVFCGTKSKVITVNVKPKSLRNSYIENIKYDTRIEDGNIIISINWDYIKGASEYSVYLKNNKLDDEYRKVRKIRMDEEPVSGKIHATITDSISGDEDEEIDLYIVGKGEEEQTRVKNNIIIKPSEIK